MGAVRRCTGPRASAVGAGGPRRTVPGFATGGLTAQPSEAYRAALRNMVRPRPGRLNDTTIRGLMFHVEPRARLHCSSCMGHDPAGLPGRLTAHAMPADPRGRAGEGAYTKDRHVCAA